MRADLLALTSDALAALTNRGLVKRATREVEAAPPALTEDPDGTVRGTFPDGPTTSLPTGGLDAGTCDCGATTTCRHVLVLVLAYQRQAGAAAGDVPAPAGDPATGQAVTGADAATAGPPASPPAVVDWSPGTFTDDAVTARIGTRLLTAARRAAKAGYAALVRRPTPADPVPNVELSAATVRFLVPHDLGFVHTDAAAGTRDDVIALAVWAFRVADEQAPGVPEVRVQVGGQAVAEAGGSGLERALDLADTVLRDGAVHTGAGIGATLTDVRRRLDTANLRWPLLAVADLADQLDAYRERAARYRPVQLADLVAELHARHRAVTGSGHSPRARVLGTEEPADTPLRRARLDSLGARVSAVGDERTVEVFLAHVDSAVVLVLRRSWRTDEPVGTLVGRRTGGVRLDALAVGNLVTESAVRNASRTVRLANSRVAKSTVTPSTGDWGRLPDSLLVTDLGALAAELDALPPRFVRPRVEAELVRAVRVAEVGEVAYRPGHQRLDATIVDPTGATATVTVTHDPAAPGRLDATAEVLAGRHGPVRYVSGTVRRTGGGIVVDPVGFAVDGRVAVPDLAGDQGGELVAGAGADQGDPLAAATDEAYALLAEVAHRGLAHLPPTFVDRLRTAAGRLSAVGLRRCAAAVEGFAGTLGPDPGEVAVRAWVDAYLRVGLAVDLR